MVEEITVGIVVAGALYWIIRRILMQLAREEGEGCTGCNGCSLSLEQRHALRRGAGHMASDTSCPDNSCCGKKENAH